MAAIAAADTSSTIRHRIGFITLEQLGPGLDLPERLAVGALGLTDLAVGRRQVSLRHLGRRVHLGDGARRRHTLGPVNKPGAVPHLEAVKILARVLLKCASGFLDQPRIIGR